MYCDCSYFTLVYKESVPNLAWVPRKKLPRMVAVGSAVKVAFGGVKRPEYKQDSDTSSTDVKQAPQINVTCDHKQAQ